MITTDDVHNPVRVKITFKRSKTKFDYEDVLNKILWNGACNRESGSWRIMALANL